MCFITILCHTRISVKSWTTLLCYDIFLSLLYKSKAWVESLKGWLTWKVSNLVSNRARVWLRKTHYAISQMFKYWNSMFFDFTLIIEGTTEKVLQFIMPLRSIYNQNIGFIEQMLYFWALQKGSNNKGSIHWHYFCHENIFLVTFLELPPIGSCQYYTKMHCSIESNCLKMT